MLKEFVNVRQIENNSFRRWFSDEIFELIIFYPTKDQEEITGFQLCYRTNDEMRVFTWNENEYPQHYKIDEGDESPLKNMTPIFMEDGIFNKEKVLTKFISSSKHIESNIVKIVKKCINEYKVK